MKKLICILFSILLLGSVYSADVFEEGTGADVISGSDSPADIDTLLDAALTEPLGRLVQEYRQGAKIAYSSASAITVSAGQVGVQNSAGTKIAFLDNTSSTSVGWSDIDTGSEAASTTYYVYAFCTTPASDTDFDITISTSSSVPSGKTYYARLGSFYNNSSSNIVNDNTLINDNESAHKQFGDWVSKSKDTSYLASTDGFVIVYGSGAGGAIAYTDSSNPPTTKRIDISGGGYHIGLSLTMPVKQGDYWKTTETGSSFGSVLWWIPLDY